MHAAHVARASRAGHLVFTARASCARRDSTRRKRSAVWQNPAAAITPGRILEVCAIMSLYAASDEHMLELSRDPDALDQFLYETEHEGESELCLERDGDAIHFLLTGAQELTFAPADMLYRADPIEGALGDVLYLTANQVRAFARHLETVTNETLAGRYDAARMRALEVSGYDHGDSGRMEQDLDRLLPLVDELRVFLRHAARNGLGAFVTLEEDRSR
jgi:hypothetical protein